MSQVCTNLSSQNRGFSLLEIILVLAILAVLAKAIDLYVAEHHGQYPDAGNIAAQLTRYTDMRGHAIATPNGTHIYGPYLHTIPPLPVGRRKGGNKIAVGDGEGVGWIYSPGTGEIRANLDPTEMAATQISP